MSLVFRSARLLTDFHDYFLSLSLSLCLSRPVSSLSEKTAILRFSPLLSVEIIPLIFSTKRFYYCPQFGSRRYRPLGRTSDYKG